jgi:aspartate/methionine/tyrosine aminotransferase
VVDETYEHFLHDGARHSTACAERLGYPGIIHIFSLSKDYGLAGWRVGYMVWWDFQ